MTEKAALAVLHITAAMGGGADRYIRDVATSTPYRHYTLHVGPEMDVLEDMAAGRFTPLRGIAVADGQTMARWLDSAGVGIVHLHSVDEACRGRLAALRQVRALPYLVTLHDLLFVNPRAFAVDGMPDFETAWIETLRPTLLEAATVIAPSAFISEIAVQCAPGIRLARISPGIRPASAMPTPPAPPAPPEFLAQAPSHIVAIVGAVGPHKGSGLLDALAAALAGTDIGVVVIGYTDTQLSSGWSVPGRLYVHGPYVDDALAGWLAAYRAEVVLFPNRLPESFSYTLSEVWACGLPGIVPGEGALGERVARHGGGWLLPQGFSGGNAAALLIRLFSPEGAAERARVISSLAASDARRVPTLEAMSRDIDALYARFAQPPVDAGNAEAAREALAPLLAVNLDGFAFRRELINLAGEIVAAKAETQRQIANLKGAVDAAYTRAENSAAWAAELEKNTAAWVAKVEHDSKTWADKLEADIVALKRDIERLADENRRLAEPKAAFDLLPEFVRRYLLQRASRARR